MRAGSANATATCTAATSCAGRAALTPFDGIEFDPALRFIDVANDIAFLTMDLAMHDRADLRRAVLQAWTQALGDFGGLPLLPYFETYRALVRAKVAALRALQEQPGSQERSRSAALRAIPRLGSRACAAPAGHASC